MKNEEKTKELLIQELVKLCQRVAEVEASETSCKLMGEELEAEKSKVNFIVSSIPSGLDIVTKDYKVQFQNKFLLDRFGDCRGKLCYKEYMNRDKPCSDCPMRRAIENRRAERTELIGADGRDYEVLATPIKNRNGSWSSVKVIVDISARKQAEEALRESEEKYRSLVESTEDSIYLVDGECRYLFVNEKHLSRFGLSLDKVTGRTYSEFHSEGETKDFADKVNGVFKTGKPLSYEYRSERDGGYYIRTLNPVKEPDGKTTSVTVVSKDITERKQTEEAVRQSGERYRATFEQAADSVVLIDGETGALAEFNERAHENLGYTCEEFRKLKIPDFEVIESAEEVAKHIQEITKEGTDNFETKHRTKGGEIRDIQVSSRAISIRGRDFVQSIWRDITKRKLAEEELKSSQEQLRNLADHLQSVREQERTSMAREIHDELGQALTALKMDISWLGKRLPKDQESLFEKTKSMSNLMDMTIKTVKRLSTELRPGILDDLGLIPAIEWQAEEFENRTGIRCKLGVVPEDIIVDPDRSTAIFRILQEALTNIARHAQATRVTMSLKEKDATVELKVRDNGKGITEEQISQPKSFGLVGIRERVHSCGGVVKIKGAPGKGTTITVSIPINRG